MAATAETAAPEWKGAAEADGVILGLDPVSMEDFLAVARHRARVVFSKGYRNRVKRSRKTMERALRENRLIYGVTTGFGDNVRTVISNRDSEILQRNIVLSHACAVGDPLSEEQVRAVMLMWLLSLGKGFSGVRLELLELVAAMLNRGVVPFAPGDGSVGYLCVESHIALVLIGEGRAWFDGELTDGGTALARAGLRPVVLQCKEGLCLTNGSNSVTGLGVLAVYDAVKAVKTADAVAAMTFEALRGTVKAFDARLHSVKQHTEQAATARNFLRLLDGSDIAESCKDTKVQDALTLRSIPQVHGAVKNAVKHAAAVILDEMNSCSDNPILFPEADDAIALMGGNFDGTYVGIQADAVCIALANLAKVSERRIDRMVNHNFSDLSNFLVTNPGLNNGFMLPQYTAVGLVGEIRVFSHPSTIDSIPTCANQEDPVSMAYFASKKAMAVADKLAHILAIELMAAAQALEFLRPMKSSAAVRALHDLVRTHVPKLEEDRYIYTDMVCLKEMIHRGEVLAVIEDAVGALEF